MVDAVETMIKAQECRHGGCSTKLNAMIAGTEPVSLDLFDLQSIKKFEPKFEQKKDQALNYIEFASEYAVGMREFTVKEVQ